MDNPIEWQQWNKSLVENNWKVHFEPEQKNTTPSYFEKFTGNVYIRFPEPNHLDHKYHMIDGDFVDIAAGKIKNWETKPTNIEIVKTEILKPSPFELYEPRKKTLYTKAILYKHWQDQVSQNTLFTQTSKDWQGLYNILNTQDCKIRFKQDSDFYYNDDFDEEEKAIYFGNFWGYICIQQTHPHVNYGYKLTMQDGNFYEIWKGPVISSGPNKGDTWDMMSDVWFIGKSVESVSLEMKIALLRYWETHLKRFDHTYGD